MSALSACDIARDALDRAETLRRLARETLLPADCKAADEATSAALKAIDAAVYRCNNGHDNPERNV